jgi:hypothetical protein
MELPKADASNRVWFSNRVLSVCAGKALSTSGRVYLSGHVEVKGRSLLAFSCALKYDERMKKAGKTLVKNKHAQALGRLGGLKGGRARADSLPPEERSAIARKAVLARWARVRADAKKQPKAG